MGSNPTKGTLIVKTRERVKMSVNLATVSVAVNNASGLPLGNTRLSRALALVIKGLAVVEQEDETRIIKSISGVEYKVPKIIRLLNMLNVPIDYRPEYFSRTGVLRRDNHTCGYCLRTARDKDVNGDPLLMTHDHILPKSRGGKDEWMNAITACNECNWKKADRTPAEAGMVLLIQPTIPWKSYIRSEKARRKKREKHK